MKHKSWVKITSFLVMLTMSQWLYAASESTVDEEPTMLAMTADVLLVRPVMFTTMILGSALYVVAVPFAALGGNATEAGKVLVAGPAKATFARCLGCTQTGYKK